MDGYKSRGESSKRRERVRREEIRRERVSRKKVQVDENVEQSGNTLFFPMFCGTTGILQGLVNVPFWGSVSHHLPISVGDEIFPFQLADVKKWDINPNP